jgi:hypothetical protein
MILVKQRGAGRCDPYPCKHENDFGAFTRTPALFLCSSLICDACILLNM